MAAGALALAGTLGLAACSASAGVKSAADAARVIGCGSPETPSGAAPEYATDVVECEIDEEKVQVLYFSTASAEANFIDAARGTGTKYLSIDTFLISGNQELLVKLQTSLGGTLRP